MSKLLTSIKTIPLKSFKKRPHAKLSQEFTRAELKIKNKTNRVWSERLSARLAVKAAFNEILPQLGIAQVSFKNIEISSDDQGKPELRVLSQTMKKQLKNKSIEWQISLSHTALYGVGLVCVQVK